MMLNTNNSAEMSKKDKEIKSKKTFLSKNKIILLVLIIVLLVIAFFPLFQLNYKDGGTNVWVSPTYVICQYKLSGEGTHVYPVPYDLLLSGKVSDVGDLYKPETLWDKYESSRSGLSYEERETMDHPVSLPDR